MTKSLAKIFELYPVFKCISQVDTSSFVQTSDNPNEIFKIIEGICNTSSQLVWLIDASLSIVPINTTISTYNLMVDIIKKSEWEDYSFEQLTAELGIEKSSYYRFKKRIKKSINDNLSLFIAQRFNINRIDCDIKEKMQNLFNITNYNSLSLVDNSFTLNTIEDVFRVSVENSYFNKYFFEVMREIKKSLPNGRHYYAIAKALLENPDKKNFKRWTYRYQYKYFCCANRYDKVRELIAKTKTIIGLILFGANYLTIDDGYYILDKKK